MVPSPIYESPYRLGSSSRLWLQADRFCHGREEALKKTDARASLGAQVCIRPSRGASQRDDMWERGRGARGGNPSPRERKMESKNRETERASERVSERASERASKTGEESANDSNLESSAFGRAWRCQVCPANLCNATPSLRASFEHDGEPTFLTERRDLEIELRGAISAERGTRVDWVQGTTDLESSLQISSGSFEATYSKAANTARLKA